jgi:hypothetical protein
MNWLIRQITTTLAFIVGVMLVCLMLVAALICKLTAWIGSPKSPR